MLAIDFTQVTDKESIFLIRFPLEGRVQFEFLLDDVLDGCVVDDWTIRHSGRWKLGELQRQRHVVAGLVVQDERFEFGVHRKQLSVVGEKTTKAASAREWSIINGECK